jgi:hypothetical protein
LASARADLGAAEAEAALELGAALTLDEALDYALANV